ncbi:MAG: tetratricopeptide repeat protein [Lachnospiraceae bacterium]|nr:tetratricopeptide repeat protein [Lachnospiraceae bacterium]
MDKKEYKLLSEEIMTLAGNEQFQEAAEIADRIDWRKVGSFSMLMKISELYQLNRRYEDALELMLMAYDRNPKQRSIVYGLCELYIELRNHTKATEFFALYKKMAPNDSGVYILQYKLGELAGTSLEDQIALLEEFNRKDYREEWAYQLAYLYHRIGLGTKCVECCNELITWFGDGPFVIKAMELKMLHAKLSPEQQRIYDRRDNIADEIRAYESDEYSAESPDPSLSPDMNDIDWHVKTIDMSKFNTINLQKALAESMRELMGGDGQGRSDRITGEIMRPMLEDDFMTTGEVEAQMNANASPHVQNGYAEDEYSQDEYGQDAYVQDGYARDGYEQDGYVQDGYARDGYGQDGYVQDGYAQDGYVQDGYAQDGYAQDGYAQDGYVQDGYAQDGYTRDGYVQDGYGQDGFEQQSYPQQDYYPEPVIERVPGELAGPPEGVEDQTMYFAPVGGMRQISPAPQATTVYEGPKAGPAPSDTPRRRTMQPAPEDEVFFEDRTADIVIDKLPSGVNPEYESMQRRAREVHMQEAEERRERESRPQPVHRAAAPARSNPMDEMLYLDADGQIGLAVPQSAPVEKQITGQIHMDDYLSDWEKTKEKKLKQQQEDLQRSISERTGKIFKAYDARKKNGLIEEMEREQKIFSEKYQANDIELRGVEELEPEPAALPETAYDEQYSPAAPVNIMGNAPVHVPGAATLAAAEEGRNIWDEVQEAMNADAAAAAAEAVAEAAPPQFATGSTGLVDAATKRSSGVFIRGEMTELTAEEPQPEEPAAEEAPVQEAVEGDMQELSPLQPEEQPEESVAENPVSEAEEAEAYTEAEAVEGEVPTGEVPAGETEALAEEPLSEEYVPEEGAADEYAYTGEGEYDEYAEYPEEGYEQEEYTGEGEYEQEPAPQEFVEGSYYSDEFDMNTAQIQAMSGALEADADEVSERTVDEMNDEYIPGEEDELSSDEQKLFADFLYSKKMRSQLLTAIDQISLASYVGNAIITGDNDSGLLDLGKALIKEIQMIDSNFVSSRVAKISGTKMNRRDIPTMFNQLAGGALLVEQAANITRETLENIARTLDSMNEGIFIIFMDNKREMDRMLGEYELISGYFNARIDIAPMNNNALVDYAKKYAYSQEYKIDEERGVLALHQRISELQIGEHNVSTREIEDIIDEAIEHSRKLHLSTFFRVLGGKRYDYEDMIILREKDFV